MLKFLKPIFDKNPNALSSLDMATKAGGIGIWTWELSTGVLTWNEPMYALFDTPPHVTPTYEIWRNALHPDDLPMTEKLLKNGVDHQTVFNTVFRIILRSGAVRYLGTAAGVERGHAGKSQRVTGICWDITGLKLAQETLKKSEEHARLLLNSTGEAIYGIDLQGNCTFANPACCRMLGYADPEKVLGKNMHELIHYAYHDGTPMPVENCSIYRAFRDGRGVHRDDEVLWRADGISFPVEYWSYPQVLNGAVYGAVVTFVDITSRKQLEKSLAYEKQRLSYILEGTNVGTWEWNVQTGEVVFNERWAEIIGYILEELAPVSIDTWKQFTHPDDYKVSGDLLEKHFNKSLNYYECEARMRHKSGNWVWVLDRGKVATWTADGKPLLMAGTHQDITERKLTEERLRHLMTHDALTDLPGLRLAEDRLTMALGMARRQKNLAGVMFIDLDGFKAVNDVFGHDAGDYVLKQVATRFLSCVRETDTVARVGGDEFLLILTGLRVADDAARIAEKIIGLVSQPVIYNGQQMGVGASIGIALYPDHGENMDQLVKQADKAMYGIKNAGKNGFGFANSALE